MKDMIVCLSGGLDSSSLLFDFKDRVRLAVSFKYPSNHNDKELECAKHVVSIVGVEHKIVDLTHAFEGFRSALLDGADSVPDYSKESISQLVVPFRNGIFLSILARLAESFDCKYVALANHLRHLMACPDCKLEFCEAMAKAIKYETSNNVQLFYPYALITKGEIVYRGIRAGMDLNWTYSCYRGEDVECGVCAACLQKKEALRYAYSKVKGV